MSTVVSQSPSNQPSATNPERQQSHVRSGSVGEEHLQPLDPFESIHSSGSESSQIKPGSVVNNSDETIYVSGDHWTSVCNEIADLREQIDQSAEESPPYGVDTNQSRMSMLLEGVRGAKDLQDVLADLPSRNVCNRLIHRYFNSAEYSIVVLHMPTFEREYQHFWIEPHEYSPTWVGLLFSILTISAFLYQRAQDPLPDELGTPEEVMELFQRRSTDCLLMANHCTAPGPYTIPALLLNIQNEFIRRRDAHLSVWLLAGVALRLAMRMGYHRDPEGYAQFTILYTITKTRMTTVFRAIYNRVTLARTESYEGIMALHRRLAAARETISPRLQMTSFHSSITGSPYLMIRRYNLELIYLKSLCLLHRHHMVKSYQDPTYNFSRITCIEAAMAILRHQADIRIEMRSGDALHRSRWLETSLAQTDFLMAAIIICLELSSCAASQPAQSYEEQHSSVSRFSQAELLETLRSAHDFLDELRHLSKECRQAFGVTTAMLNKFSQTVESQQAVPPRVEVSAPSADTNTLLGQDVLESSSGSGDASFEMAHEQFLQSDFASSTLEGLESFWNTPEMIDWDLWEAYVRGANPEE
ncbi:uncharacterized protein LTR77_003490 [Saxophila tyrrhenica]|uniref:Transcription factor domain-containing protein n=1 Tax=Saxophila tyrrhenica TaxID=1690608 RepID=A0AAV9PH68_9PEZI|nr:hypothetical protein LTR77_003490 [Saxophila tyrrhenica]